MRFGLLNMKVPNPIEKLKSALGQNQIVFPASQFNVNIINSTELANTQAIYVHTSESQLRSAIALLTDVADITSYSMPDAPSNAVVENVDEDLLLRNGFYDSSPIVPTASSSTARLIKQDLFLSRDSDSTLKFKSHLGMSVPAVLGVNIDDNPNSVIGSDKTPVTSQTRASESPSVAKSDSFQIGGRRRAKTAPQQKEQVAPQTEPTEAQEKPWFELAEESPAPKTEEKLSDEITPESLAEPIAPEKMKRFLLLIRFDRDPITANASEAPVTPGEKQ